jgi:exopolyphosphatase/guanosine-5'-triphosphate,3'-diphosphate pyrophosphatase
MKYAAIDIGSNALRLLIGEVCEDESKLSKGVKKMLLVRVPLRLGATVFSSGVISSGQKQDLIKSMLSFKYLIELYGVSSYKACATSAMREASNVAEVLKLVQEKSDVAIELISGVQEAELIRSTFKSQDFDISKNHLYCDVGGGSTELSILIKGKCVESESFQLGTVRMLQEKVDLNEWKRLDAWIKHYTKGKELIGLGSGGNITKIMKLVGNQETKMLACSKMICLIDKLSNMTMEERMREYRLKVDRADVIIPAGAIFKRVMQGSKISKIFVPKIGLSDGIVLALSEGKMEGDKISS